MTTLRCGDLAEGELCGFSSGDGRFDVILRGDLNAREEGTGGGVVGFEDVCGGRGDPLTVVGPRDGGFGVQSESAEEGRDVDGRLRGGGCSLVVDHVGCCWIG